MAIVTQIFIVSFLLFILFTIGLFSSPFLIKSKAPIVPHQLLKMLSLLSQLLGLVVTFQYMVLFLVLGLIFKLI